MQAMSLGQIVGAPLAPWVQSTQIPGMKSLCIFGIGMMALGRLLVLGYLDP